MGVLLLVVVLFMELDKVKLKPKCHRGGPDQNKL